MKLPLFCFCLASASVAVVLAAGPEATVTSSEPFTLRGAVVPVAGVSAWPLLAGDELSSGASTASVKFKDGSTAILGQNSSARFEDRDGRQVFRLLSGTMDVKPAAATRVSFFSQSQPLATRAGRVSTAAVRPAAGPPGPPGPPPGPPPGHPPPPPPVSKK